MNLSPLNMSNELHAASELGRISAEQDRPLYAPRNPFSENDPRREAWEEGADEGGINRDYTNGVRNDGKARS